MQIQNRTAARRALDGRTHRRQSCCIQETVKPNCSDRDPYSSVRKTVPGCLALRFIREEDFEVPDVRHRVIRWRPNEVLHVAVTVAIELDVRRRRVVAD